jgi:hypothetical protein
VVAKIRFEQLGGVVVWLVHPSTEQGSVALAGFGDKRAAPPETKFLSYLPSSQSSAQYGSQGNRQSAIGFSLNVLLVLQGAETEV